MSTKTAVLIHPFFYSPLKRGLDILVATGTLILLSPLFGVVSLVVLVSAGRPIIFKQQRMGLKKQIFWLYKFRTMKIGAEKTQAKLTARNEAPFPMFKLHEDPRFVGLGKWLSNTGLDELPQLVNVIKGEMSLVGPRPLPVSEAKTLHQLYSDWRFRELVKPGIFSEWSLDAKRHSSIKHWQRLDQLTLTNGGLNYEIRLLTANAVKIIGWASLTSIYRFKLLLKGKSKSK